MSSTGEGHEESGSHAHAAEEGGLSHERGHLQRAPCAGARRFELVDWKNRPWATLGFDEGGEVQFAMPRARLSVTRGEVELELLDDNAHECLKLHVDRHGAPHILTRKGKDEWTDMCAERGD